MQNDAEIVRDENLVAFCGLYCGACPRYLKGKCEGCRTVDHNPNWCKVKPCNVDNEYNSCADCTRFESVAECKAFNPLLIRLGEYLSKTSRQAGIQMIKEKGQSEFVAFMAENQLVSIKRG